MTSPLAVESLRQDIGVESPHTAKARLQDPVFAYLAWPCHQRDGNGPKLSAQSKYYFVDPLMARLAPLRSSGMLAEADASAVSEQQLGIELLRNMEREQPGAYAHFSDVMYQKTADKEVNFCGPRIGKLGFEGKYVELRLEARGANRPSSLRCGSAGNPESARHQRRCVGRPGAPDRLDAQRLKCHRCERGIAVVGRSAPAALSTPLLARSSTNLL